MASEQKTITTAGSEVKENYSLHDNFQFGIEMNEC